MSLNMPDPKDVLDTIETMLGKNPGMVAGGDAIDLAKPPAGTYLVPLNSEAGEIVGAIIANIGATVYLGGSLIMMPEGGLGDQVRSNEPEEVVLEAFEEVINMLRGVVSKAEGNQRVTPGEARPLKKGGDDDWVAESANRLDLSGSVSFGPVQLAIVGR